MYELSYVQHFKTVKYVDILAISEFLDSYLHFVEIQKKVFFRISYEYCIGGDWRNQVG
jgi:hypothetical protein